MGWCLVHSGENTSWLHNVVSSSLTPWDVSGVPVHQIKQLDLIQNKINACHTHIGHDCWYYLSSLYGFIAITGKSRTDKWIWSDAEG